MDLIESKIDVDFLIESGYKSIFITNNDKETEIFKLRTKMLTDQSSYSDFIVVYSDNFYELSNSIMQEKNDCILSMFEFLEHTFLIETSNLEDTMNFLSSNSSVKMFLFDEKPTPVDKKKATIKLFCNSVSTINIHENAVVRVNMSPINTVGIVRFYEKGKNYAWVRCIPRIDYDEISKTKITSQHLITRRKGLDYTAPLAVFNESSLKSMNAIIDGTKVTLSKTPLIIASANKWDGSLYEDNFLLVKVDIKNIQVHNFPITNEEEIIINQYGKLKQKIKATKKIVKKEEKDISISKDCPEVNKNVKFCNCGTLTQYYSAESSAQTDKLTFIPNERPRIVKTKKHELGVITSFNTKTRVYSVRLTSGKDVLLTKDDIKKSKFDVVHSRKGYDKNYYEVLPFTHVLYKGAKSCILHIFKNKGLIKKDNEYLWVELKDCLRSDPFVQSHSLISELVCLIDDKYYTQPVPIINVGDMIETTTNVLKYSDHGKKWQFFDEIKRDGKLKPRVKHE